MDKKEMEEVFGALTRINRSLDERFEKNADLYIAPEQVEKLKQLIYLGNYEQLVKKCSLKKYSAKVLANVLIKNAWLMRNSKYYLLKPIFEECDYNYLQSVMRDGVFDNKIEMPLEFRLQLIEIFLDKGEPIMCQQMLEQKLLFLNHPRLKAICLRQALKNDPILNRYRRFNNYVGKNKNILTQEAIVAELFPANEFTDELRSLIFEEQIKKESPLWDFWKNRLSAGDIPFMMTLFKKYCRLNSSNLSSCKKIFGGLYPMYRKDFELFADKFADACTCMDGDKKQGLAQSFLSRLSTEEEAVLQEALVRHGITGVKKGTLATIDEIGQHLSTFPEFRYKKALFYLISSFDRQYYNDCDNMLNKIGRVASTERFEDFCLNLTKNKYRRLNYLLYVIEQLVPPHADKNDPLVSELLKHIEDKFILGENKSDPNIDKVIEFVKKKDFDLFTRTIQFIKGVN